MHPTLSPSDRRILDAHRFAATHPLDKVSMDMNRLARAGLLTIRLLPSKQARVEATDAAIDLLSGEAA